jgi:hypothetical protein
VDEEKIGQLMLPIRTARKFVALPPPKKAFHGRAAPWGCGLCRGFFAWQARFAALRQELSDQTRPIPPDGLRRRRLACRREKIRETKLGLSSASRRVTHEDANKAPRDIARAR